MKKKKLNSKNPKYMDNSKVNTPKIKEKTLISSKDRVKIYAIKYENTN
jgi:hypothetical protein